jgi:hypothetical protein
MTLAPDAFVHPSPPAKTVGFVNKDEAHSFAPLALNLSVDVPHLSAHLSATVLLFDSTILVFPSILIPESM